VLEEVSPRVFRGDKLALKGRVKMGPEPVVMGRVRVVLTAPGGDGEAVVRVLGYATTGPDGRFDAKVTVPPEMGLGNWEVIAEFVGDARRSPSHSR